MDKRKRETIAVLLGCLVTVVICGPVTEPELLDPYDICDLDDGGGRLWRAVGDDSKDEEAGKAWLDRHNKLSMEVQCELTVADWNYNTNLTDDNLKKTIEVKKKVAAFENEAYEGAMSFDWQHFSEPVRRQFSKVVDIGYSTLDDDKLDKINSLGAELERIYSIAEVCDKPGDESNKCYPLDPDLTAIMATSRDWDELVWAWQGWRNSTGPPMVESYRDFLELQNEAAELNGYEDGGAYWRSWYETPMFETFVADLWAEVKPLYKQLHAYVRRKLRQTYPDNEFPKSGHIPAHLLGNMWAQQWNHVESIVRPFPDAPNVDVTEEMIKQGYDVDKLFRLSEEFFESLGCDPMVESFWPDSMLSKPTDRKVVCHASAWDFMNQKDFRVKQCTEINMDWLFTTHHEMGHIVYFMEYKHHPTVFRDGANPGFHEAIGDVLELSVSTPEHLHEIGLLPDFKDNEEMDLNFLMEMALRKIVFLPFGYLIDQWRWSAFKGDTKQEDYNEDWWDLRCNIQGVSPPVSRSSSDFDPGSKFHVPNNTPYIRYFISHLLQFQIHQSLCEAANNTRPLHRCDIYNSKEAGKMFRDLMQLGSSMQWQDAMEKVLGTRDMDISAIRSYFRPLMDFLEKENEAAGEKVGWDDTCDTGI